MRTNTLEKLREIYHFIDVKVSEEELNHIGNKYDFNKIPENQKGSGKVTRTASPGKWKENFSEEEQKIMNEIMEETLTKCGYI